MYTIYGQILVYTSTLMHDLCEVSLLRIKTFRYDCRRSLWQFVGKKMRQGLLYNHSKHTFLTAALLASANKPMLKIESSSENNFTVVNK